MLLLKLALMNIFHSMWSIEDIILNTSLLLPAVFSNRHVAALFEASVLKEVRILRPLSPR